MDSTIYASRVGHTPNQAASNLTRPQVQQPRQDPARMWADKYFGSTPYQGQQMQRNAPTYIYGGGDNSAQVVQGANAQPDVPVGTLSQAPQPEQPTTAPTLADRIAAAGPAPVADLPPESVAAFKDDASMEQAGLSPTLPTTPPKMPKDPTNGKKEYDPTSVTTGQQAITYGMQNNMPQAQSPVQAQTQAADHDRMQKDIQYVAAAKNPKQAWQEVKKDPFYKNSDFYTGLMNVGLAIMSGANPMQAFQAGKGAMDKATMATQMGDNRQALIDQGYSPASVEAAITSGDASKLQMQQMSDQDRMAAEDQLWGKRQEYQQDVNAQQTAQSNAEWDRRNAIQQQNAIAQQAAEDKRYQQRQQDQLNRSKALIDYRGQKKAEEAQAKAQSYDFDSRTINAELKAPEGSNVKAWSVKTGYFDAAQQDMDQLKAAVKAGDSQAARAAYQQVIINAARGEIGENRSLQGADLHDFASDPSIVTSTANNISLKAGWAPDEDAVAYLEKGLNIGRKTADHNVQKLKEQRIRSLSRTMDKKRATALVNRAYGGGWHDPYNVFDTEMNDSDTQGALSGLSGGGLNDFGQ